MKSTGVTAARIQLIQHAEEVAYFERRLGESRRVRDLLVVKLIRAGETTRDVGELAGITSPGVSWIVRRAKGKKA